jgi:hypothetical protein
VLCRLRQSPFSLDLLPLMQNEKDGPDSLCRCFQLQSQIPILRVEEQSDQMSLQTRKNQPGSEPCLIFPSAHQNKSALESKRLYLLSF